MTHASRFTALLALALVAITALVYWPGLNGPFLFDDYPNIVSNTRVQPQQLDWAAIESAARGYEPGSIGRPLATIGFAIDYWMGGKNPWGYKLHSLLVHLLNALLIFALVRRLLSLTIRDDQRKQTWPLLTAFAITLLWAVHPLQISSVLYVVQRMETLSLTFVLLGLLAYLRGRLLQRAGARGWTWLGLSAVMAGAGLLSKENAVLFPLYTLALELTILRFDAQQQSTRKFLKSAYAIGLVSALFVFFVWILPSHTAANAFDGRNFNLHERLLSQLRILPMYICQILLPLPQSMTFYYDAYPKSTGWLSPATTLFGAFFLIGLATVAWRVRERFPLVALGILWFFAAHVLTSNVFNLELAFEHRNYFALLGILLVVADLLRLIPLRDGPALKYFTTGVIVLAFAALGMMRAATWGSELHLASDLVAKNPQSPRASSDLATLYAGMADGNANSPFFVFAMHEFERASLLPNASPLPEQGLILLAASTGQPQQNEWWDRLVHKVRTRPISPQEIMAVTGIMNQRYKGIEVDDSRLSEAYAALLERRPRPELFAKYGDYALTYLHDEALADRMFAAAVDNSSTDPSYAERLFSVLVQDGRMRQAQVVRDRANFRK